MAADTKTEQALPKTTNSSASWAERIFSFPVMCSFLLAAVIFAFAPPDHALVNSDLWWHLLHARNLLQNHSLSRIDTYSFTAAGSPWLNFDWLSEVPFFLGFEAFGCQGIMAVYFGVMVLIFTAVYCRACRAGTDCKDAAIATVAGICLGGLSRSPRTQLFGWLCMVALLLVLDYFRRTQSQVSDWPCLYRRTDVRRTTSRN